jgi:hypothetical protein
MAAGTKWKVVHAEFENPGTGTDTRVWYLYLIGICPTSDDPDLDTERGASFAY